MRVYVKKYIIITFILMYSVGVLGKEQKYRDDKYHLSELEKLDKKAESLENTLELIISHSKNDETRKEAFIKYIHTSLLLCKSLFQDLQDKIMEWGPRVSSNPEVIRELYIPLAGFYRSVNNPKLALRSFKKYFDILDVISETPSQSIMFSIELYKAEILIECGCTTQGLMVGREALQKNLETEAKERKTCLYPCLSFLDIAIDTNNIDEYSTLLKQIGEENPQYRDEIEWLLSEVPYIIKESKPNSSALKVALSQYALSRFMSRGKEPDFDEHFEFMSIAMQILFGVNISKYKNYPLWLQNFYMDSKRMGKQKEFREQLRKWEKEYPFLKEHLITFKNQEE